MKIASRKLIEEIEKRAAEELHIPHILLMENAALKIVENTDPSDSYFVVICGTGNNGGDGLACARHLAVMGKDVDIYYISKDEKKSELNALYLEMCRKMKINIIEIHEEADLWDLREAIDDADCVIDAMFGIGLSRPAEGIYAEIIGLINLMSAKTISCDIPSGINADTGEIMGAAVKAHKTVTFSCYKKGFLNYETLDYSGEIVVENIGIPDNILAEDEVGEFLLEYGMVRKFIPRRKRTGYKGDYGRVLVVAGSPGFTGANRITSEACIHTGAGLVTVSSDPWVIDIISEDVREAMTVHPDDIERAVASSDVIAFGPGMGNTEDTFLLLMRIVKKIRDEGKTDTVLILDADGINVLAGKTALIENIGCRVVMTPHFGEMARLTGRSPQYISRNRIDIAKDFAKTNNITLVLKGYNTIITDGEKCLVNTTGSSAIATGGMGDCLTGIIASLAGQGLSSMEACASGVFLHGYIGDELASERYSITASEIIKRIPFELKKISEDNSGE